MSSPRIGGPSGSAADPSGQYRMLSMPPLSSGRAGRPERRFAAVLIGLPPESSTRVATAMAKNFRVESASSMDDAMQVAMRVALDAVVVASAVLDAAEPDSLRRLSSVSLDPPASVVVVFDSSDDLTTTDVLDRGATDVWCGVPEGEGVRARVDAIVRDVRLMAAENELVATRQKLEAAGRLKSEFFSTMSHELRTPLNAIIGFSEMMKDGLAGPLSTKQSEFLEHVFRAGGHLLELIDEILDLSKLESGRMRLEFDLVDLDGLVTSAVSDGAAKAKARGVVIQRDGASESIHLECDARRVKQIVAILIANAIASARRDTTIVVGVRAVRFEVVADAIVGVSSDVQESEFDVFVEISVEHEGKGLDADDLSRVFVPLMGADERSTKATDHNGLGLALVNRLAELHGGAVAATSEPDVGSRFLVFLPLRIDGFGT